MFHYSNWDICSCVHFNGISQTMHEPQQPGTCPSPRGPQEWNRWETRWPGPRGGCEQEPVKRWRSHFYKKNAMLLENACQGYLFLFIWILRFSIQYCYKKLNIKCTLSLETKKLQLNLHEKKHNEIRTTFRIYCMSVPWS